MIKKTIVLNEHIVKYVDAFLKSCSDTWVDVSFLFLCGLSLVCFIFILTKYRKETDVIL